MAKQINIGVGGVVKKVKEVPIGIGGVVKKAKKGVCGIGGVVKEFFNSSYELYDNGVANGTTFSYFTNYSSFYAEDAGSYFNCRTTSSVGTNGNSTRQFVIKTKSMIDVTSYNTLNVTFTHIAGSGAGSVKAATATGMYIGLDNGDEVADSGKGQKSRAFLDVYAKDSAFKENTAAKIWTINESRTLSLDISQYTGNYTLVIWYDHCFSSWSRGDLLHIEKFWLE